MIKQYLKQAWRTLRANPILSLISIVATAFAIAMMMVLVMTDRIKTSNFPPEVHRNRTLFILNVTVRNKEKDNRSSSSMSSNLYKEVLSKIKSAEAIAIGAGFFPENRVSTTDPKGDKYISTVRKANLDYWKCYEYHFLYGHGFGEGDMESGVKKAILSEAFARKLFGRSDVVGETVMMDYEPFDVVGVVATPSNLFIASYADMWIPYTAVDSQDQNELGDFWGIILAKNSGDFPKIQAEMEQLLADYNAQLQGVEIILNNDNHLKSWREMSNFLDSMGDKQKEAESRRNTIAFMILFILVPAINLATLTFSRHEQKLGELGVRRSYGASRWSVIHQVITESLLYTLIGGLLGFLLSIVAVYAMRNLLFLDFLGSNFDMSIWQIFNVWSFLIALLLCLILNLLSSIMPAWLMSRKDVIDALNRR
ncbi:MAG: ABC transporter permease [Bacteroidales bacterium]|uniref:ABC transporter permease n=1 Tax=Porphyromonas sp. TaxID=1924944 RepID=UPI00297B57F2|nr:ABC transporter permease [Porphyromonas sp.]MDD7437916.1 ABC transporter permease [Bacteroidales bacterium]MDY3067153.1 FtsX-like permease family protein [Porphyromonas sp.]